MLDFHSYFADFMKQGVNYAIVHARKYLEDTSSFDLSILSDDGYVELGIRISRISKI